MSAREPQGDPSWPLGFDGLGTGRLTWIGLIVAALGWILLIGAAAVTDILPGGAARATGTPHADLLQIAECLIASGFALAVIGALQSGFGALNRFFAAVLLRSSHRPATAPLPAAPIAPASGEKRPYRKLADGSVEVETILGTRRFATMREAADFI